MASVSSSYEDFAQAKATGCFPTVELECAAWDEYSPSIELKIEALEFEFPGNTTWSLSPVSESNITHGKDATPSTHLVPPTLIPSIVESGSPNSTDTAAKNPRSSALAHADNSVKPIASASGHDEPVLRSTRPPAPPTIQSNGASGEPILRSTAAARQEAAILSTTVDDSAKNVDSSTESTVPRSPSPPHSHTTSSNFPPVQGISSHLMSPPLLIESFKSPFNGILNEDIEMSCSSPSPETLSGVSGSSFAAACNSGPAMDAFPLSWMPIDQPSYNAFVSSYANLAPQVSAFPTTSYFAQEPASIYPVPFASNSYSRLSSPTPILHPTIFDLIQNEPPYPVELRRPNAYIIPPVVLSNDVWQQEIIREQLAWNSENNKPRPSKRSRLSAPYFLRTPLVVAKNLHRRKTARTAPLSSRLFDANMTNIISSTCDEKRAPSAAFSGSSSASTFTYCCGRKLSSPPPFKQRFQRSTESTDECHGLFRTLASMFWSYSYSA
ncbi:hypothetical protein B0H12DRAFT_1129442 [Mycena haematopus]|nr:hypothetical protein B0H12DRAFT_1129442 [Mycena haematopus]